MAPLTPGRDDPLVGTAVRRCAPRDVAVWGPMAGAGPLEVSSSGQLRRPCLVWSWDGGTRSDQAPAHRLDTCSPPLPCEAPSRPDGRAGVQDPAAQRMLQHWVDIVGDMLLRPHPAMPIEQLLEELYLTFGTEVSWAWRDTDETFGFLMYEPIPGWPVDGQLELWAHEAMALHPLIQWFRATGDLAPTTLERVPAEVADPRGLQILRHHLLPVGLEQQ